MNKGIETLKEIWQENDFLPYDERYKIIEKELKALEIIKNYNLAFHFFIENKYSIYNNGKELKSMLTKEEYDLLKEVLKNE